ncbi:MAG: protein kinase, partial [Planctomycetes bacterium]|nr:protein kinase [Planctomycetota bacterium]
MSDPLTDPTRAHSPTDSDPLRSGVLSDTTGSHSQDAVGDESNPLPAFHPPTQPGDLGRLGRYRLLKPLGKGGMGAVYLGYDDVLQRKIAIKVLTPKFAANKIARERFLREARTAASVASPHVVAIIDVDEDLGIPFIAMEYLQGIPLDRYLSTHSKLSLKQVLRIGQEVARGLAAAHAAGLVHRDIKPANLWLEAPHGHVKILDFGLAKETDPQGGADVTQAGQVVGTPAFMSPEQARGDVVDARTDLFCLGIVLYRLCTGKQPFVGPTAMAVLMSVGIDEPTPVRQLNPAVPEALASLIYRLLRKKPADRPQTATDVHADLVALENEKGAAVPEASVVASVSDYVPITVPPQGDRVWEQFDAPTAAGTATTQTDPQRKAVERVPFPWKIVGGVFALLVATLALVAILMDSSKRPQTDMVDADLVRPNPVTPNPPAVLKGDPDRRAAEWVLTLPGNQSVELVGQAQPVTHLGRLPAVPFKVRRIHISSDYTVTDADIRFLQDLTAMDALDFKRTLISDAGMDKLSKIAAAPRLVELSLGTEELTDEGMRPYVAFRALRNVTLTGPHLSHQGIKILQYHCPNLTHLTLDRVKITDWDLAPFCLLRWFMRLEHLGISCPTITPLGLGFLSTWPGLKSIS